MNFFMYDGPALSADPPDSRPGTKPATPVARSSQRGLPDRSRTERCGSATNLLASAPRTGGAAGADRAVTPSQNSCLSYVWTRKGKKPLFFWQNVKRV
jgi:hypothetical protein